MSTAATVEEVTESTPVEAPTRIEDYSPEQRTEFFKTGARPFPQPPAGKEPEKTAEEQTEEKTAEADKAALESRASTEKDKRPLKAERDLARFEETRQAKNAAEERATKAEKEAAELKARVAELEKGVKPASPAADDKAKKEPPPDPEPVEPEMPSEDSYSDYNEYDKALKQYKVDTKKYIADKVKWDVRQAEATKAAKAERDASEAKVLEEKKATEAVWSKRVADATKRHADWEKVALPKDGDGKLVALQSSQLMDGFLLRSDLGAEILYELGKNPALAKEIAEDLDHYRAHKKLIRIEDRIQAEIEAASKPLPEKAETAPALRPKKPRVAAATRDMPTELAGNRGTATDPIAAALQHGDTAEYMRLKNAEEVAERRRKREAAKG